MVPLKSRVQTRTVMRIIYLCHPSNPRSFLVRICSRRNLSHQSRVSRLASPGSVSTASAPSQPRQSSQLPLARSSILPLSRPLCGSRALRAANFLNSLFPSPGQFIPCGPFADRERVDRDWEVGSVRLAVEGEGQVVVGEGDGS
jgi:hypothetical protein